MISIILSSCKKKDNHVRNSNQDNLQVFRKICTEQGYADIGFVKVELSNPVYFFKSNRGQYEVKLGYHQSKYDNKI